MATDIPFQHITYLDPANLPEDYSPEERETVQQLAAMNERHQLEVIRRNGQRVIVALEQPTIAVVRTVIRQVMRLWQRPRDLNTCQCVPLYKLYDARIKQTIAKYDDPDVRKTYLAAIDLEMHRFFPLDKDGQIQIPQPNDSAQVITCPNPYCRRPQVPSFWTAMLDDQVQEDLCEAIFGGVPTLKSLPLAGLILKHWFWNPIALPDAKKKAMEAELQPLLTWVTDKATRIGSELLKNMPQDNLLVRIFFSGNSGAGVPVTPTAPLVPPPVTSM
jgi:hypothetical protein